MLVPILPAIDKTQLSPANEARHAHTLELFLESLAFL